MGRVLTVVFAVGLCALGVTLAACGCTANNLQQGADGAGATGGGGGTGGATGESRAMLVCADLAQATCDMLARCQAMTANGVVVTYPLCDSMTNAICL